MIGLSTRIVSWFFFFLQQLCLNAINSPQSVCSIKNWQMFPKCLLGIFLSVYICSKDSSVFLTLTYILKTPGILPTSYTHTHTHTHTHAHTQHTYPSLVFLDITTVFSVTWSHFLLHLYLSFTSQRFEMRKLSDIVVIRTRSLRYLRDCSLKRKQFYTPIKTERHLEIVFGTAP